jgi:hypothetical protein
MGGYWTHPVTLLFPAPEDPGRRYAAAALLSAVVQAVQSGTAERSRPQLAPMSWRAEGGTRASKSASVETLLQPGEARMVSRPERPQAEVGSGKGSAARSGDRHDAAPAGSTKEEVAARWSERRKVTDCVASPQREASAAGSGGARKGRSAVKLSAHCGGEGEGAAGWERRGIRWRRRAKRSNGRRWWQDIGGGGREVDGEDRKSG